MKKNLLLFIYLYPMTMFLSSQNVETTDYKNIKATLLADGFSFTEGPAADREGNIFFTDQPNDKIYKWLAKEKSLSVFSDECGRANGLYFDRDGALLSCSDKDNELWKWNADGTHKVLINDFEGKKLNGPNDLWVNPKKGTIYFTDPLYKRDYWQRNPEMQQDGQHVYCLSANRKKLIRVTDDLKQPNGIIGTPDGKRLYVADIGAGKTYRYDIQKNGTLSNKTLFCNLGSDGMTIDIKGNIYLTGKGVTVFNPQGEQIAHIDVDAPWTANVCFGGDGKTLFITASKALYCAEINF
ncbi:MAG: SMP-30/gluconolactonase/LRE family protein [Dysgonamonadaceae bacterium]|jgi:gluconolactonase|nr:SMP-30/gluconolactonase/LRE family protein [Dysgonamonadaceae bacterium]